jgi:serine/threonine-protein kinase
MKRQPQIDTLGLVGTNFGRYYIKKMVGSGSVGIVYLAQDVLLKRDVAVKVFPHSLASNQEAMNYFFEEASKTASLKHPGIARVDDVGHKGGRAFMVMEWLDGRTLEEELREKGRLPVERVAGLLDQICDILAYVHSQHIVHRDLKPSNVMLVTNESGQETIHILDFAIARSLDTTIRETLRSHDTYYASPEQLRGGATDERSDIYSLGVMIFELLTGERPFKADSIHNAAPPPLCQFCPSIPQAVENVVLKALAKDPIERYQSATDLAEDFHRAASYDQLLAFTWADSLKLLIVRFAKWAGWLSSLDQDVLDEYINFQGRRAMWRAMS